MDATTAELEIMEKKKKSLMGKSLLLANYLFVSFLSKHFIAAPHGGAMFVIENIGTLLVALLLTTLMYCFLPNKVCLIAIPVTLGLAAIAAFL